MNNELLRLLKKQAHILIQQTKTTPQETLEFKMKKRMETFSFYPTIYLSEEGIWFLGVPSFEATNSVVIITHENSCFSITLQGHWNSKSSEKTIDELNKILELKTRNDIDLHVEQVKKRNNFDKRLFFIQSWYLQN